MFSKVATGRRANLWVVRLSLALAMAVIADAHPVQAGGLGGAILRGAANSVRKSVGRKPATRELRRDLARDRASAVHPLPEQRTVFRYTSSERARRELKGGIPPNHHMTSRAGPGRPLSAGAAQRRYGLPQQPDVRETIDLPRGQALRLNRVVGGAPGVGEATSPNRVPPAAIKKAIPLR